MAERTKATVSKTVEPVYRFRGFKSHSLRARGCEATRAPSSPQAAAPRGDRRAGAAPSRGGPRLRSNPSAILPASGSAAGGSASGRSPEPRGVTESRDVESPPPSSTRAPSSTQAAAPPGGSAASSGRSPEATGWCGHCAGYHATSVLSGALGEPCTRSPLHAGLNSPPEGGLRSESTGTVDVDGRVLRGEDTSNRVRSGRKQP